MLHLIGITCLFVSLMIVLTIAIVESVYQLCVFFCRVIRPRSERPYHSPSADHS